MHVFKNLLRINDVLSTNDVSFNDYWSQDSLNNLLSDRDIEIQSTQSTVHDIYIFFLIFQESPFVH